MRAEALPQRLNGCLVLRLVGEVNVLKSIGIRPRAVITLVIIQLRSLELIPAVSREKRRIRLMMF